MNIDDRKVWSLALHSIQGIGGFTFRQLISYSGSPENVFKLPLGKLRKIPGIGPKTADLLKNGHETLLQKAKQQITLADKFGTDIIFYFEDSFPYLLKQVPDTPSLLFKKGNVDFKDRLILSIVGTRNATSYGLGMVREIIEGLTAHNPIIVSGLAYGIDIESHKVALKNNLETVAVLASGVDVIYPAVHKKIAREIVNQGALLSEYELGDAPEPGRFPARNRIIAGLSEATIVIEAAPKGGALITANIANSYDRDVFAVPGNTNIQTSEGCNQLIKTNRAHLLSKPEDIEYILGWSSQEKTKKQKTVDLKDLDEFEKKIITTLKTKDSGINIDELSWRVELPVNRLASILLNLEFRGYVNSLPGKMYKLAV